VSTPKPPRRTQAERRQTTETRLLAATADLVAEKGIDRTTLAEIGERAGYSRGIVSHHFGSKAVLIERLAAYVSDTFAARFTEVSNGLDGMDGILALCDLYLELVVPDRSIIRANVLMWANAPTLPEDLRAREIDGDRRFRDGFSELVSRGHRDGSVRRDLRPGDTAIAIVGMLRGIALQLWLDPSAAKDKQIRVTVRDLLSGLATAD
jgi:AcrR family transcriptional regulator